MSYYSIMTNFEIIFSIFFPVKFQMKNNFLYLKELTANGSFNISITAMFEGRNDSKITVNIPLTLKGKTILCTFNI